MIVVSADYIIYQNLEDTNKIEREVLKVTLQWLQFI